MKKIIAIPLCFLLAAVLVLFSVSLIGAAVISPAMKNDGTGVSESVNREELELVRDRIDTLAGLYGFNAEPVKEFINEETLRSLNWQASRWWSSVMQNGKAGDDLSWDTSDLRELLYEDTLLTAEGNWNAIENKIITITQEVRESLFRVVLPLRQSLIRLGLKKVGERIDLPNVINFFMGVPWTALALCALLAGVIALLESRDIVRALPYIGSALGGAALVLAALVGLYLSAGIMPMIREASQSLVIQYRTVETRALIIAAVLAVLMITGCCLCLRQRRKGGRNA